MISSRCTRPPEGATAMPLMIDQRTGEGVAVAVREHAERLSDSQVAARRHEDWYLDNVVGRVGEDGVRRTRSVRLIADLYGVDRETVRRGIEKARRRREEIADARRLQRSA